ncbi:MAG: UDP-N-acetylglucosamine 2-epimerase (non-hydrolyzing) [Candidatus Omnitrophota bacterium]
MKLMLIFGTRPEAIKMAPIISCIKTGAENIEPVVCVTAQHREMLDQALDIFNITPDYDLDIMRPSQDLFSITANTLMGLKNILIKERPDMVLVQGDTTTAFVAGLAAYYLQIPVGHVEAGLRTYDKYSPFPEEVNRHFLSVITDIHFAPTDWARSNLLKEGISASKIVVTGNTVVDALLTIKQRERVESAGRSWNEYFRKSCNLVIPEKSSGKKLILVTGHRRENFGSGFRDICFALKKIAKTRKDVVIVYPVHLNPNVVRPVKMILGGIAEIHLIKPLEYGPFIHLMDRSYLILTDSGGIQEEAPSLGKPVLVMRDTTERPEGIRAGVTKLVGTGKTGIVNNALRLLDDKKLYKRMSGKFNPYGDGKAAARIVKAIAKTLINGRR